MKAKERIEIDQTTGAAWKFEWARELNEHEKSFTRRTVYSKCFSAVTWRTFFVYAEQFRLVLCFFAMNVASFGLLIDDSSFSWLRFTMLRPNYEFNNWWANFAIASLLTRTWPNKKTMTTSGKVGVATDRIPSFSIHVAFVSPVILILLLSTAFFLLSSVLSLFCAHRTVVLYFCRHK